MFSILSLFLNGLAPSHLSSLMRSYFPSSFTLLWSSFSSSLQHFAPRVTEASVRPAPLSRVPSLRDCTGTHLLLPLRSECKRTCSDQPSLTLLNVYTTILFYCFWCGLPFFYYYYYYYYSLLYVSTVYICFRLKRSSNKYHSWPDTHWQEETAWLSNKIALY